MDFLKEIKSSGDPDSSDEAKQFYTRYFKQFDGMTGETICSLGTTFGIINKEGEFKPIIQARTRDRRYVDDEKSYPSFYEFREQYHSLANFMPNAKELNMWRGGYDRKIHEGDSKNQGDYFDIFLWLVKQFYSDKELLPVKVKNRFDSCSSYLNLFTSFNDYVDKNYLNPFVTNKYEIKDIFSVLDDYKIGTVLLGTYHEYGDPFPEGKNHNKDGRKHAQNYIKNSLWIWEERAKLFANK